MYKVGSPVSKIEVLIHINSCEYYDYMNSWTVSIRHWVICSLSVWLHISCSLFTSVVDPDPDPDPRRDGENRSETDPGSIKGSQNKGDRKFTELFIRLLIYRKSFTKSWIRIRYSRCESASCWCGSTTLLFTQSFWHISPVLCGLEKLIIGKYLPRQFWLSLSSSIPE